MKVGVIGEGRYAAVRRGAVEGLPGAIVAGVWGEGAESPPASLDVFLGGVDVALVTVPTAEHFRVAEAAAKQGVHVLLEWPPATSIRECKAVVRLAEEAGIEAGVSRPFRFHPVFGVLPPAWRAHVIVYRQEAPPPGDAEPPSWSRRLADAVDLCCALAQSGSVQRIEAEAARTRGARPDVVAAGLRFHSGTYAQISLRQTTGPPGTLLYAAGGGYEVEADLGRGTYHVHTPAGALENGAVPGAYQTQSFLDVETRAFLQAVAGGTAAPVSVLDGLHTMRLVERLMERLR